MSEEQAVVRVNRPRRRAETIHRLVKEFHESNLSLAEFCRSHALPLSTFKWYLRKHRDGEDVTGGGCAGLVAVEIARPTLSEEKPLAVVLPKGRKIEIGIGFDASTLAQIVAVLERI
jgi:hypothetical protein